MIDPTDKVIDSRDIEPAIRELQATIDLHEPDEVYGESRDLDALDKLNQEGIETFGDEWLHGVTLLADWYFTDYAQELAADVGAYDADGALAAYIDWERWATAVQMDYTSIEFNGNVFWGRA